MKLLNALSRSLNGILVPVIDDESTSSTFAVGQPVKAPSATRPVKKSVGFDLSRNIVHKDARPAAEVRDLWYQDVQMRFFKDGAYRLSRRVKSEFHSPRRGLACYQETMDRVYTICLESSGASLDIDLSKEIAALGQWADAAPDRIGLEYLSVRSLKSEKSSRRTKLLAVLRRAKRGDYGKDAEVVRSKCEAISKPSRAFAYCLAASVS